MPTLTADDQGLLTPGATLIPTLDLLVARYCGRDVVPGQEVVDMLLDLRLLAVAGGRDTNGD